MIAACTSTRRAFMSVATKLRQLTSMNDNASHLKNDRCFRLDVLTTCYNQSLYNSRKLRRALWSSWQVACSFAATCGLRRRGLTGCMTLTCSKIPHHSRREARHPEICSSEVHMGSLRRYSARGIRTVSPQTCISFAAMPS